MARDIARGVAFDEQVEVARVDIRRDGRVGADDLFAGNRAGLGVGDIELGGKGDVLADGQAEDGVGRGQAEAVDGCVVGNDGLFRDGEFLVFDGVEHGFGFCGGD
nr:hypothetical protein CFP56_36300 [Quercus suber]